jgi:hypothetical protein
MLRNRAGICLVAVLAIAGSLLSANPAVAAVPDLVRVSNASGLDSSDAKNITATCPVSSPALLSAGYRLDGGLGDVVVDQFQLAAGSATVFAYEADPDYLPEWRLTVYAVCADAPPGRILIPAVAASASPDFASLSVTCPAGDALLGAGFGLGTALDGGEVETDDLRPNGTESTAPTSVLVGAFEADPYAVNWSLTTFVVCADPLPGLVRRTAVTDTGATDFKQVTASCDADEVLVGSGYEILGGPTGEVVVDDLEPGGDGNTPPTSVAVDAYREDDYTDVWELQAYAICAAA